MQDSKSGFRQQLQEEDAVPSRDDEGNLFLLFCVCVQSTKELILCKKDKEQVSCLVYSFGSGNLRRRISSPEILRCVCLFVLRHINLQGVMQSSYEEMKTTTTCFESSLSRLLKILILFLLSRFFLVMETSQMMYFEGIFGLQNILRNQSRKMVCLKLLLLSQRRPSCLLRLKWQVKLITHLLWHKCCSFTERLHDM